MKKLILFSVLCLFLLTLVSAQPFAEGSDLDLKIYCNQINCTGAPDCNVTVSNPNSTVFIDQEPAQFNTAFYSYNFTVPEVSGSYSYNLYCSEENSFTDTFDVTPNGEQPTTAKAFFYLGLMGLLVFFLCMIFWAHMQDQSHIARFWWFSFMWIPIWALIFIGWNMARDFLTSQGAIQGVLYYGWLTIGIIYPFFILILILYTFYWIYKQQEVQRLVNRGFSLEDAQNRAGGRGRGMMN